MLTSKQRAYLRGVATRVKTTFQIGKDGVSENLIKTLSDALEANEIVKIHILENCSYSPKKALELLAKETEAEEVCTIGYRIVLYKESKKHKALSLEVNKIR